MYLSDGMAEADAEAAADTLLNSPAQFPLPTIEEPDAMSHSNRLIAAGRAG
jgi:hypothetical protein